MSEEENKKWQGGQCSGTMYHGGMEHYAFLNKVFSMFSYINILQRDLCPSGTKFEAEVLAMVGKMLHGEEVSKVNAYDEEAGAVTSGGTESIYNAMYVYREWGRDVKGITAPEVVAPMTIHPAHLKAAHYLGMKVIRVPVNADYEADVEAMRAEITPNTVALAGSAGTYPNGVVDPFSKLSDLALEHKIGLHVDGCLGGFILPWIEKLGYDVPVFDFRLPGVTSISCDTHKYGYALKGTSTINFRNKDLRRYMIFAQEDWPGGIYTSSHRAGQPLGRLERSHVGGDGQHGRGRLPSRPRGPIMDTADKIRAGIAKIPELRIMGKIHLPDQPDFRCSESIFRERLSGKEGLAHERLPEPGRVPFLHHPAADPARHRRAVRQGPGRRSRVRKEPALRSTQDRFPVRHGRHRRRA